MKILTWNLKRPNSRTVSRNKEFLDILNGSNADIIVLTETNLQINLGAEYFVRSTLDLAENFEGIDYAKNENRVTIFSKYPFTTDFEVTDPFTTVCSEIITESGPLIIFGTIIGVTGGKDARFTLDFKNLKRDISRLRNYKSFCICGDFNVSFTGYTYPSRVVRNKVSEFLNGISVDILTKNISNSVDHIALSRGFLKGKSFQSMNQTFDSKLTDHNLVQTIVTI